MADQYSNQYQSAFRDDPASQLQVDEFQGKVRRLYADITLSAEIGTSDLVKLAKLPKGAVPIQAKILSVNGGSAGVIQVGWAAGANGDEAADADGIMGAISTAAAVNDSLAWTDAGFNKRFAEEVELQISATTLTVGMSGELIQFELLYIMD